MDRWMIRQTVDLAQGFTGAGVWPNALMIVGDSEAHTWQITVLNKGKPADLTSALAVGYFIRSDTTGSESEPPIPVTVRCEGNITGNVASVTLAPECYAVPGPVLGMFRLTTAGGVTVTLSALRFTMRSGPTDAIVDPGDVIPSIDELLAQMDEMEKGTKAANDAAGSATAAAGAATNAAGKANTAANNADTATGKANTAAGAATDAAGKANTAANNADAAAGRASTAAGSADAAAGAANTAAGRVDKSIGDANTAAGKANTAANTANTAAGAANTAANTANTAAGKANTAADRLSGVDLEVTMLPPSAEPTSEVEQTDKQTTFKLGIPTSNLAYATFEVDDSMNLLMHSPDGFDDINFALNNGELEVSV